MRHEVDGKLVPIFTFEEAQALSADQIISLFQFDHYPIRHDDGGPAEPWNLLPRLIREHRIKTAKIDVPQMRKADRISAEHADFRRRMLTQLTNPHSELPAKKSNWTPRPFPKKRKIGGRVERRT
jgi:hypothetical protein